MPENSRSTNRKTHWEEEWRGINYQCFWAEKDELAPVSTNAENLHPGGGAFYGKLWVSDGVNEPIFSPKLAFTLKPVNSPVTTVDEITEVTATTATFTGSVDPNAPHPASEMTDEEKEAYRTWWEFRCEPGVKCFPTGPSNT